MSTTDTVPALPSRDEMLGAFLARDAAYDGVFVTGVTTTGIFCRPTCPARKPRPENVVFYPAPRDALLAGYRPCMRCRPLEPPGAAPDWLAPLLARVEADPARRWRDADLRELGLRPERVRRWFLKEHGMTFHAYHRSRRLGTALGRINGGADVTTAALDAGYDSHSGFGEAFRQLFGDPPTTSRDGLPPVTISRVLSPLGPLLLGAVDDGLCLCEFVDRRMLATQLERVRERLARPLVPGGHALIEQAAGELEGYFAGELEEFSVPLVIPGTPLQEEVWRALLDIPFGTTTSYGELARLLGRPGGARAVGRAVGDNRIAIMVPCHRVVGADGRLTGYGGGLWRKRRLLELEGVLDRSGQRELPLG